MASISYIQLYISGWLLQINAFTLKSWLTFMRSALSCGILLLGDEFLTPAPRFSRACLTQSVILSAWLLSNQRTPLRLAFLLISQQRRADSPGVHFIKWCDAAGADGSYLNLHNNTDETSGLKRFAVSDPFSTRLLVLILPAVDLDGATMLPDGVRLVPSSALESRVKKFGLDRKCKHQERGLHRKERVIRCSKQKYSRGEGDASCPCKACTCSECSSLHCLLME